MRWIDLIHRWAGGIVGLLLALMGLSGALLVHRDAWVMLPHAADAQVQDTQALARAAERMMADPAGRPESIIFATENFGLHRLSFKQTAGAYADQSGAIATRWASQWERPEMWIFDFHHHLFAGEAGEAVIGIAGVCGMLFVLTGAVLWWRTRKTFEFRLIPVRLTRPSIVRHHRDLGIVVAPLLMLSFVTGSVLIFRPLATLLFGPGAPAQIDRGLAAPPPRPAKLADRLDWAAMVETARARFPDAELRTISLPRGESGLITLRMRKPMEWLPNGRTTLWFAADTGALVAARDAQALPLVVRGYNALYPLHAAKIGGLPYRLVMTVSGLAMTMLGSFAVWTFWFRRPKSRPRSDVKAARRLRV